MPDQTTQQIRDVFCAVLESQAFMFGDPVDKEELSPQMPACIEASIRYRGPTSGELTLLAPKGVAGELAANLLGLDPDDDNADALSRDALGELMNVTLGQLLTTLAGDQPVFDLDPPQVREATTERWRQMIESSNAIGFVVEDNPVLLELNIAA